MENNDTKKTLNFIEELHYDEAVEYLSQYEYLKAINILYPLAAAGDKKSQDLLCEVFYEISAIETERVLFKDLDPKIYDTISQQADKDANWANFIMHCYLYARNDSPEKSYGYLEKAIKDEEFGLAYLRLGILYGWGVCVEINLGHAQKCYEKAIECGCKQAYSYLGQHFQNTRDAQKVISCYRRGIELGDRMSYERLINFFISLQSEVEFGEAHSFADLMSAENQQSLFDITNPQPLYFLDKAESVAIEMLEKSLKNSYYYYGIVQMNKYLYTMNELFLKKTITYFELAIKHKQYKAYGGMALLYKLQDNEEESQKYAQLGTAKSDSFSRLILIDFERDKGDYIKAWQLAMDSWKSCGLGGNYLAKLYLEDNYQPGNFDVKELIKILEAGIKNNNTEAYGYIKKLLSIKKSNSSHKNLIKYQQMAADYGYSDALYDYGKTLLNEQSTEYNPFEGSKYLEAAIRKGNVEAARLMLRYRSKEDDNVSLNDIRNLVIRNDAYLLDDDFFDLLYPTDVVADTVNPLMQFMSIVAEDEEGGFLEINKIKAEAKLLINHINNVWTLSNEERIDLREKAIVQILTNPSCMVYFRSIWKEIFPDFDVNSPSVEPDWMKMYYSIFESREQEAEMHYFKYKENEVYDDYIEMFRKNYNRLCDDYDRLISQLEINVVPHGKLTKNELKHFDLKHYLNVKNIFLEMYISLLQSPILREAAGTLVESENIDKLFLLDTITSDSDLKDLLKDFIRIRIEFDRVLCAVNVLK